MSKNEKIPQEVLNYLNYTDNVKLKEYRSKYKNYPIRMFFLDLINELKVNFISEMAGRDIKASYKRRNKWDKLWIITLLKEYRESCQLSEGMGKHVPIWSRNRLYPVDRKIAPVIFALNKIGVKTNYSCQGREDGIKSEHSVTAYISTFHRVRLPQELLKFLEKENVKYDYVVNDTKTLGDCLYSKRGESSKPFLDAVTKWAFIHGVNDIHSLKNYWKR